MDAPVGSGEETELIVRAPGSNRNAGPRIACADSDRLEGASAAAASDAASHLVNVAECTNAKAVRGPVRKGFRERVASYGSSSENVCATIIIGTLIDSLSTYPSA